MSEPCRWKIRHTKLASLTCRDVVFAGLKVFLPAGGIMVKSPVIALTDKNLNNSANVKYYAIIHCAWKVSNPVSNWQPCVYAAVKELITINRWALYELWHRHSARTNYCARIWSQWLSLDALQMLIRLLLTLVTQIWGCVCIAFSDDTGRKTPTRAPKTECLQLNSDAIGVYVRFTSYQCKTSFAHDSKYQY